MRLALSLLALPLLAAPPFEWKTGANQRHELFENGKPVLVYNAGVESRPEAPPERARCCYVYPLYTPAGVSPLDDFPKDHWHHRGLFWAWPYVSINGKVHDIWMKMDGIHDVTGAPIKTTTQGKLARLDSENYWEADGVRIVRERASITVHPAQGNARTLDLKLTFEALDKPVELRGSQEKGKSYGGLNVRFAPREATTIRSSDGPVPKDTDLVAHEWAEFEAVYGGKRAVVRFESDKRNPHAPPQWCLRYYGFVGAAFPGRTESVSGYTLVKGKPLTLRYRVTLTDLL
ncbi:MAG TPA: PmoA family protein [Bryobacteraceae bacterium]|nr:PmoA family protein [Bryobacteraceae bacterium]HPT25939.1 PmoA family protein [Bryobacteraceae bacterium]